MPNGRERGSTLSRPSRVPGAIVLVAGVPSPARDEVHRTLSANGHEVVVVESLGDVVGVATNRDQDMIILVAPDPADVTEACVALRTRFQNPVFVVCAHGTADATVASLDAGADDVMCAPISGTEFMARVAVALRYRRALTSLATDDALEVGKLRIDMVARSAVINGDSVEFSPNEFRLLCVLAQAAGRAVPAATIAAYVWPEDASANLNRLRICVTRLRKLLAGQPGAPLVVAERGVGYTLILATPEV